MFCLFFVVFLFLFTRTILHSYVFCCFYSIVFIDFLLLSVPPVRGSRCSLEVLQLSVQQEGEADMDVELLRKGLLAVKLKGEEEVRGIKPRSGKGNDAEGVAEGDLMMPGGFLV